MTSPAHASLASLASNASVHSLNAEEEKEVSATKSGAGVHDDDMGEYFLFWN